MPPLGLSPNRPAGAPDITSYGYGGGVARPAAAAAGTRPRFVSTANGPVTLPADWSDEDARQWVTAYDQHIATLTRQWEQTSGLERRQIEAQIEDAKQGRKNAMEIAQLQAQTSRYGTDAQTQQAIADRMERQRQFDANHGLDLQKFGLDVANSYTQYAQTYDDIWALQDFKSAIGNIQRGGGPSPLSSQGSPRPKTMEQFAVLANYPGSQQQGASMAAQSGGGGSGTDPRITAANSVMKALPPSESAGNDGQDWAALRAIESLYFGKKPGEVEKLGKERGRIAEAGLARLGYNPKLVAEERRNSLPWQGSVRSA